MRTEQAAHQTGREGSFVFRTCFKFFMIGTSFSEKHISAGTRVPLGSQVPADAGILAECRVWSGNKIADCFEALDRL